MANRIESGFPSIHQVRTANMNMAHLQLQFEARYRIAMQCSKAKKSKAEQSSASCNGKKTMNLACRADPRDRSIGRCIVQHNMQQAVFGILHAERSSHSLTHCKRYSRTQSINLIFNESENRIQAQQLVCRSFHLISSHHISSVLGYWRLSISQPSFAL